MYKKNLLTLAKFVCFILLFYVLSFAGINGVIFPFAFGMMFALVWCDQKWWLVMPAYLLGTVLASINLFTLIESLTTCIVLLLPLLVHKKVKKNMKIWEMGILAIVSQSAFLFIEIFNGGSIVYSAITVVLGTLFMFSTIGLLEAVIVRGLTMKLTSLEIIYGAFILLAISSGLCGFSIGGFQFVKLFAALVILFAVICSNFQTTMLFSSIMALGTLVHGNNAVLFAPIIIWALTASAFKLKNKIFPIVALVAVEALIGWYFNLYYSFGIVQCLPVIIACVVMLALPKKVTSALNNLFVSTKDRIAIKDVANRNRELLYRRLSKLSEAFEEMNHVFRSLIKQSMTVDEVKLILFEEVRDKNCEGCQERNKCHRQYVEEMKKVFDELISIALERGRITLLDIPTFLTSRCTKLNAIVTSINTLTKQYKKYATLMVNIDSSKLLIADNLSGLGTLLKKLAKDVETSISFDTAMETKLIDELSYYNILCGDAIIYEKGEHTVSTSLIIRDEDAKRVRIPEVVSKVCNCKMAVCETTPSARAGFTTINLETAPRYDCIFGIAKCTKTSSKTSGDCYTLLRLDNNRFMLALCDGMGSGEKAAHTSDVAIGLIENFYKAGFESDMILSSVNKLLGINRDDMFSALDVCVIDLKNGIADFIKMGAPSGMVKTENGAKLIESGALPLGIVEGAMPKLCKTVLSNGETVILYTDGIADSFGDDDEMKDFINSIRSTNPQSVADEILAKALSNNNGVAMDDMTILCARVFEK